MSTFRNFTEGSDVAQVESLLSSLSFSLLVDIIKLFFFPQEETYHSSTFVHQEIGVGLCFPLDCRGALSWRRSHGTPPDAWASAPGSSPGTWFSGY